MSATVLHELEVAIRGAESVGRLIDAESPEGSAAPPTSSDRLKVLDGLVWACVFMGEALPGTWRLAFNGLRADDFSPWTLTRDFEVARNSVRKLFFTCREGMDKAKGIADAMEAAAGEKPAGMDRLLKAMDAARRLEEEVFRDWPPFTDPLPPVNPAERRTPEESLAEMLGITVEQAREKMAARRRELNAGRG